MTETTGIITNEDFDIIEFKGRIRSLEKIATSLDEENKKLKSQLSNREEEIKELKSKIDPNEYFITACRDCNWEGSSKFLRVSQFDECDITCPCCHSKNLVYINIDLNDDQSISNLHGYIDMQNFRISSIKSQLSNREEEIKELKEALKKITELEHQASEPFSICDADYNYVADQDRIIADAKSIALASLQSKEGEK